MSDSARRLSVGPFITTSLQGRDAVHYTICCLTFVAIGLPLCIRILLTRPVPEPRIAALLIGLGLISFHLAVELPSRVHIHPGFPLLMSALYYHGISGAILVIVPASLVIFFTKKHGFCNCVFNAAQFTLCLYVTEAVGLWAGWRPGVPADSRALLAILLMILTYDFLNAAIVSITICIGAKKPYLGCLAQAGFVQRRALLPQHFFLSTVAMSLSSHMGNAAIVLMFIGVLSLRLQSISQRELILRTEEAQTDSLTRIHNMRYLHEWLNAELGAVADSKSLCSFVFADIDGLKAVNDRYGHEIGNQLIVHVSRILLTNIRGKDQVARYGGDEFVVALPNTALEQAIAVAVRVVQNSHDNPLVVNGENVHFGISIGVASWPEHGETAMDTIRMADKAMYLAKQGGGNTVRSAADL